MKKLFFLLSFILPAVQLIAQAENEIQVYASPTLAIHTTIFELHSNYTIEGNKFLADQKSAHWTNESLEITHGFGKNFELGFYVFTGIAPDGSYQYQGNHIRPRVTVPTDWNWPVGASLSVEFGFIRPNVHVPYVCDGEIRPIIDKTISNWYVSFNPNLGFVLSGNNKGMSIAPQFKTVYTIQNKVGVGIEYYSDLGSFKQLLPGKQQEHLLGPMLDIYLNPLWEINTGFLFGLTDNSNQKIFKLLLGRRINH